MGRPKLEFDWSKLDAVLQYGASLKDCANIMDCCADTVEKRIKKERGMRFSEYRDKRMTGVKFTLIQKAIEAAKNGNTTMLIFCLKNLCGWADKQEQDNDTQISITYKDANKLIGKSKRVPKIKK